MAETQMYQRLHELENDNENKPVFVPIGQVQRSRRMIVILWVALVVVSLFTLYLGVDYYRSPHMYPMYVKTYTIYDALDMEDYTMPCTGADDNMYCGDDEDELLMFET
jgi:hypothetical protein